jgi:hypothetical protein
MKTDLDAKIAQIKADYEAQAQQEIERYKLSFEVDGARKELEAKHRTELKELDSLIAKQSKELASQQTIDATNFERKYGVAFTIKPKVKPLSTNDKCKYVLDLKDKNDVNKFVFKDGIIIGVKGEPVTSTIIFKDADGNKQSLSVKALLNYLS